MGSWNVFYSRTFFGKIFFYFISCVHYFHLLAMKRQILSVHLKILSIRAQILSVFAVLLSAPKKPIEKG